MIAAAVIVVALGLGLVGAGLWSLYQRSQTGSAEQTATATPGVTDAAAGGVPTGATPPEGQPVKPPVESTAAPPAATTETRATVTQAPVTQPPASQASKPAPAPTAVSQAPAAVTPPPPTAPPTPTTAAGGATKPPAQAATPPDENLPATVVKKTPPPADPPAAGAPPAAGGVSPAAAAAAAPTTAKPPAPSAAPAGDLIPDTGSFGWRSKALTASPEWQSGFQRGIIRNYEDMYSRSPANWAAVAPGAELWTFKVVVGRLQNLSGLDRPQIQAAFPGGLQIAIDEEVGTEGTVVVNAQIAVVAAIDDEQGHSLVVEMIFRDPQGKVLAKVHHRTEGRDFEGAVEDMVTELTDFVVGHPVIAVKKVK
jgi:hypothetical protein